MTAKSKEEFRKLLMDQYGKRPFYFRTEPECKILRGNKSAAAQANADCTGKGLSPFYMGKRAAYWTDALIDHAVERFSTEIFK